MSEIMGVLFAVLIASLFVPKFANMQSVSNTNIQAVVTAQEQQQFIAASTKYIQQNYVAIEGAATAAVPALVTVAMLQAPAVNLLPASFSATNPNGQTWQLEILQPTAGNLQALAMTTGGTAYTDTQGARIAALVGAAGGFIPANDSGAYPAAAATAMGAFAGWTQATANYTLVAGGHLAALINFNAGQLVSNYLYRNAVPGQPQLNTMNTPLIMASNQIIGAACATNGAIASTLTGAVVSCVTGVWTLAGASAYWINPVATYAALPVCNAASAWQTGVVQTPTTGTGPRAYTCDATSWRALAVNDAGNLVVGNTDVGAAASAAAAGTLAVGTVELKTLVTAGVACATNGAVATDSTGLLLSCKSGLWTSGASVTPGTMCGAHFLETCGSGWRGLITCQGSDPALSCPSGYTQIYLGTGYCSSAYYCVKN